MISNNPSGPDSNPSSENEKAFGANAVKKLEELGLSNQVSKDLASLKAEMPDTERNQKIALAVENEFPGGNNEARVQVAVETLKKTTEEKDQFAKSVAEKSIASRESLWAETSPKLKTKTTEVTDLIESSVFSIKATGKFAKDIIIDFFQAIRIAGKNPREIGRYLLAQADGEYVEPGTTNNTTNL